MSNLYRKALDVDPNDFEAVYSLAVLDWQRSYQLRAGKRAELKLRQKKRLLNYSSCFEIRSQNLARVQEGISLLTRGIEIAESHDAKMYLSFLYQERADIQCGDEPAYDQDVKSATHWARKACNARHSADNVRIVCQSVRCPPPALHPYQPANPGACSD